MLECTYYCHLTSHDNHYFIGFFSAFPFQNLIDGTRSFVSSKKSEKYHTFEELISIFIKTKNKKTNKKIIVLSLFVNAKTGENFFVFHVPSVSLFIAYTGLFKKELCVDLYFFNFFLIQYNSNKKNSLFYSKAFQSRDNRDKKKPIIFHDKIHVLYYFIMIITLKCFACTFIIGKLSLLYFDKNKISFLINNMCYLFH